MLHNSLTKCFQHLSIQQRCVHFTAVINASVFMKKQKRIDPEVAKVREQRKRRKLEAEIRRLQRMGKQSKPISELEFDQEVKKNIAQYQRSKTLLSGQVVDERAVSLKAYTKSRNHLMIADDKWIHCMLQEQDRALQVLREVSLALYDAAIQPNKTYLPLKLQGPMLTAPIENYDAPDGDFVDTTPDWTKYQQVDTTSVTIKKKNKL